MLNCPTVRVSDISDIMLHHEDGGEWYITKLQSKKALPHAAVIPTIAQKRMAQNRIREYREGLKDEDQVRSFEIYTIEGP